MAHNRIDRTPRRPLTSCSAAKILPDLLPAFRALAAPFAREVVANAHFASFITIPPGHALPCVDTCEGWCAMVAVHHLACGSACGWRTRFETHREIRSRRIAAADRYTSAGQQGASTRRGSWRCAGCTAIGRGASGAERRCIPAASGRTAQRRTPFCAATSGTAGDPTACCSATRQSTPRRRRGCSAASHRNTAHCTARRQNDDAPASACRRKERATAARAFDPTQRTASSTIAAPRRPWTRPRWTSQVRLHAVIKRRTNPAKRAATAARGTRTAQAAAARTRSQTE
jgi:hypothetical protein